MVRAVQPLICPPYWFVLNSDGPKIGVPVGGGEGARVTRWCLAKVLPIRLEVGVLLAQALQLTQFRLGQGVGILGPEP